MTTRASSADLLAGLSIAGLLLPEAVAYSGVANLPPQAGVIGLFAGLLCYGLLRRRRSALRPPHAWRRRSRPTRGARSDPGGRCRLRLRPSWVVAPRHDVEPDRAPGTAGLLPWARTGDCGE